MKIRYIKINENDSINCVSGINISVWLSGCPHRCRGCFNPETWPSEAGIETDADQLISKIITLANANGVERGLSILGGEPLSEQNFLFTNTLVKKFRETYPNRKIYIWTGYTVQQLAEKAQAEGEKVQQYFLLGIKSKVSDYPYLTFSELIENMDHIIDGPFIEEQKDLSLKLRGSKNQHIYRYDKFNKVFILEDDDIGEETEG